VCVDVAVTSALRPSLVAASAADPLAAVRAYAARKRAFMGTEASCAQQGMGFTPFVLEADGGAGPEAAAVLAKLFADGFVRTGIPQSVLATRGRQLIAMAVQIPNGAALVRHRAPASEQWRPAAAEARAEVAAADAALRDAAAVGAARRDAAAPRLPPAAAAAQPTPPPPPPPPPQQQQQQAPARPPAPTPSPAARSPDAATLPPRTADAAQRQLAGAASAPDAAAPGAPPKAAAQTPGGMRLQAVGAALTAC
jgi:hypothetical protein